MTQIGKPPCDEAAILHGAEAASCSNSAKRWTLVAAILGSSMAFVDGTVVNVALPAIQRELNADAFDAQWVVESYALMLAALVLAGGALGDRFGRRRMFMTGASLFVLASVACGLSGTVRQLIVSRAAQGVGAALLVPGSLALISAVYPEAERGRAVGIWSAFSGITAAVGPVVGGFLVDRYSWSWAFFVNVPIGAALLLISATKIPESKGAFPGPVDLAGAALVTVGLAGLVYALIEAPTRGASNPAVQAAAVVGAICLAMFGWVEARTRDPMLPLGLFRNRDFAGANLLTLFLYAALGGGLFFFPLNLIQVQGYDATAAGAALLPFVAIMFMLSGWAGKLVDRFGSMVPLVAGPVIAAAGFALFAVPGIGGSYWLTYFPAVCVLGFGMTVTVAPLTATVMNSVGAGLAGVASGVNNAVSRTAALLAIAVFGGVLAHAFGAALDGRLAVLALSPEVLSAVQDQRDQLAGLALPDTVDENARLAVTRAVAESYVSGFRWLMLLCAALALASACGAWLLIDRPRTSPAPR